MSEEGPYELTADERDLLEILNQNSTLTRAQLADQLSWEAEEVENLTEQLIDHEIIQPLAVIDPRKVGFTVPGYAFAQCEETYNLAIEESLKFVDRHPDVQSIGTVYGEYDIIIRKLSDDIYKLNNFATNAISYTTAQKTCATTELVRWHGIDLHPEEWETDSDIEEDIDDPSRAILEALQDDPKLRQNLTVLGERIDCDFEEVNAAVSSLEKRNLILGYSIEPNLEKLDWGRAYLGISTLSDLPPTNDEGEQNYKQVRETLLEENRDERIMKDHLHVPIIGSGLGMGTADIFLEVIFESMDHLDGLTDEIREIDGVKTTRTYIEANTYHADRTVPLG